ncbi:MAG: M56 family metallopeptidase [Candidatus Entotheonellia bacterium]
MALGTPQGGPMHSVLLQVRFLALAPVVALLLWPALLVFAADGYFLFGVIQGCLLFAEGSTAALVVIGLSGANALLLGSLAYHAYALFRIAGHVSHLPLLGEERTAALRRRLPALNRVTLRLCEQDQPYAFTVGWRRPAIVLSRWVLQNLDGEEILAAIAHELAHIRHRDDRLMFWVHSLCPGGLGLGLLRRQLAHLSGLIETRADRIGVAMMGDRLALASALVKVRRALLSPASKQVSSLTGEPSVLRRRIGALLDGRDPPGEVSLSAWVLATLLGLCTGLLVAQADERFCSDHQCRMAEVAMPEPRYSQIP